MHRSKTLVDLQLDAKNSYLFIYNIFIKILYMFRALPCSSSGGLRRNCIYAASGIVTFFRWLSCAPVNRERKKLFLNRCTGQSPAFIALYFIVCWVTRYRSWLRHCAKIRKVAGSIPNGVIGILHWHNPFGRTMTLGLTQPLTEMSTRNISWW